MYTLRAKQNPVQPLEKAVAEGPVHILYENEAWLPPLVAGLEAEGLDYQLYEVCQGLIDIGAEPPKGIYLNRMSPSSHTRGHDESVQLMVEMLIWLEGHGRRVINGSRSSALEVSKLRQDMALRRHGILTPRTILAVGTDQLLAGARTFEGPFITKHNQGGKGLGIQLFNSVDQLEDHVASPDYDPGPRGQMLIQQYIDSPEPFITRVEIVGGQFLFAMRSETTSGFELCPSDACQTPAANPDMCAIDGSAKFAPSPLTSEDPIVLKYLAFCEAEGLDIAGIEFVEDHEGTRYTYDINGTTNYSSALGEAVGVNGMREIARYLGQWF